jgi:gluconokinase
MSRGEALNEGDRLPWLNILSEVIGVQIERSDRTILACSALKKDYRVQLTHFSIQLWH